LQQFLAAMRSIRTRLQVVFVAFAGVAVLGTEWESAARSRTALLSAGHDLLTSLATQRQVDLERTLELARHHAATLAGDLATMVALDEARPGPPPAVVQAALDTKLARVRALFGYSAVALIAADGAVRSSSPSPSSSSPSHLSSQQEALFAAVAKAGAELGEVAVLDAGVVAVAPVRKQDRVAFVIALLLGPAQLEPRGLPASVHLALVDDRGRARVGSTASLSSSSSSSPSPPATTSPMVQVALPATVGSAGWQVIVEQDEATVLAPIAAFQQRLPLHVLAIVAVVAVVGWLVARTVTRPLKTLRTVAIRLGERAPDAAVDAALADACAASFRDEVGALAGTLQQMVHDLRRTTVSRERLDAAHAELHRLNARLIHAQEDERARVARELHDDVVQRLASLAITTARLKNDTIIATGADDRDQRDEARDEERRVALGQLQASLAALAEDVHGLSRRLHPSALDDLGLDAAVADECRYHRARGGPAVDLAVEGAFEDVEPAVRLALFRVVQEALRNTARHARATHVALRLDRTDRGVVLDIVDDGCGFDCQSAGFRKGLGLMAMVERMRHCGGACSVTSSPGQGTRIHVEVDA
jgi:signal transduction histidine kinase